MGVNYRTAANKFPEDAVLSTNLQYGCTYVPCRDIKPDNVLVAEDGRLMVTDFGLSKSYGTGGEWIVHHEGQPDRPPPRQSNDVVTEGYVPPELLLGAQSYGPEVDIWVRQILKTQNIWTMPVHGLCRFVRSYRLYAYRPVCVCC